LHNPAKNYKHGGEFITGFRIRFKEKTGEQATMFFPDPGGYAPEFKVFHDTPYICHRLHDPALK